MCFCACLQDGTCPLSLALRRSYTHGSERVDGGERVARSIAEGTCEDVFTEIALLLLSHGATVDHQDEVQHLHAQIYSLRYIS